MNTVLIAGGTGLIGQRLSQLLHQKGYKVHLLSRKKTDHPDYTIFEWDLSSGKIDPEAIASADYVINLAGAGIADKRWSDQRKQLIIDSRVKGTQLLFEQFKKAGHRPKAYIASAAIGFYGDRGDEWLTEESGPGTKGFLAESCVAWEKAIQQFMESDIRTVGIRIGLVLSMKGGALEKMILPFRLMVGSYFGSGKQWYSWIHIEDLCHQFIMAIEREDWQGFYNGVAPNPVRNREFATELKKALQSPALIVPAPTLALRVALGEMADAVLTSSRVSSQKIEAAGFSFQWPELLPALQHLLKSNL